MEPAASTGRARQFDATRWSLIVQARGEGPLARSALETLCRGYWFPLYAFVRRSGYSQHDAEDLTQAFFSHVFESDFIQRAAPEKGRFRQIRGVGMRPPESTPLPSRRVLGQTLHDPAAVAANPPNPTGPAGSVHIAADGSTAAFLPARRATSWQLTDAEGTAVVRERFWITFQPGEIRSCTSCHGLNSNDQSLQPLPANKPEALRTLLQHWKTQTGN